eukprot:jgi/Psemu1/2850/gm1.2850_g
MTKRKRCEWWPLLRDEIVENGGLVHPALSFSDDDRALLVRQKVSNGEIVLRIPAKSFVTKDRALSMCQPWLPEIIQEPKQEGSKNIWNHSPADLSIAVALAGCQSFDSCLYLHSLPDSSSFDTLPRRWSDEDIHRLLAGTSLLKRIVSDKKGVVRDYELLLERYQKSEFEKTKDGNTPSFPPFEKFSDMLAAVTSRAFQIGNTDGDIALVPILDLGNHTRGKFTNKLEKKNVSYQYDAVQGAMIVASTIDIDAGESIRLTYGAKANAELLLNYGFCIPRNIEPDGSSNDVLEFQVGPDKKDSDESGRKTIVLRTGPKSYSYGGFAATLEEYFEEKATSNVDGRSNNSSEEEEDKIPPDNDFEAFMNECDNENDYDDDDDEGDGFTDLYGSEIGDSKDIVEDKEMPCVEEIDALERFKLDLVKLSKGYNSYEDAYIQKMLSAMPESKLSQCYSTILSLSELRTIYFFLRTIEKVQSLLCLRTNSKQPCGSFSSDIIRIAEPEDLELIDTQTNDLAKAYMAIRHGDYNI